jgi:hypothetical protein
MYWMKVNARYIFATFLYKSGVTEKHLLENNGRISTQNCCPKQHHLEVTARIINAL